MEKKSNKKPLIALLIVALVGLVGGTWAYFTSQTSFENKFKTADYKVEYSEDFTSPENWLPGTTTNKTLTVKNDGDVDVAVRVRFEEKWTAKNKSSLPLEQTQEPGSKKVEAAVMNFHLSYEEKWESEKEADGNEYTWYYYKTRLGNNESTETLIDSVTFNKDIQAEVTCTGAGTTLDPKVCTTGEDSYAGAEYVLTFYIETIQYDAYKETWKTSVEIA